MKTKFTVYLGMAFIAMAAIFLGCKGDDGAVGPVGLTGDKGDKGTTGDNGKGFDEAAKDGNILIYLDGTRPDGIAFKDTLNFKFSPTSVDDYSYAETDGTGANYDQYTYVGRFLGMDNYNADDSYSELGLREFIDSESLDTVKYFYLYIYSDVLTSDFKYFRLDDYYYSNWYGTTNTQDSTFTGYQYDASKGSIKHKFKFTSPAGNNSTGYDLNVSGVVDATVYQSIETPCVECGRAGRTSRTFNTSRLKPVVKAEMKSLK
jgi:hypothetical protein